MQRGFRTVANQSRNPRVQTPVTRHPLFPAIVALWFGALFGLGSLAIRPGLIESAVLASGIDAIVPAAGPPLGITARILIALTLAAIGGMLGATIARRIAEPRPTKADSSGALQRIRVRTRDAHPDAPARRPLSVPDEISAAPLDQAAPAVGAFPGRRRALAIAEDAPQFRAHEYAPLPGGASPGMTEPAWSAATEEVAPEPAPLELGAFAAPVEPEPEPAPEPTTLVDELPRQTFRPLAELAPAPFAEPTPDPQFAAPMPEPPFAPPVAEPIAASLFAAPPPPPLEFARLGAADPAPFAPPQPAVEAVLASAPEPALDGLDLTALTERFAASLRRRREQQGDAPPVASEAPGEEPPTFAAPAPEPEAFVPEVCAEPEQPAFATAPLAMPAAFRPLGYDDADDDDLAELESLAPLRQFRMPVAEAVAVVPEPEPDPEHGAAPQAAVDEDAEPEPEPEIDGGYSSLLELGRPPAQRQSFVRIEEPDADHAAIEPVVIFPGQAARLAPAAPLPLAVPQPFAAPEAEAPALAPDLGGTLRRFDAPANAQAGQAVSAASIAPQGDREETERALRAALATLQRMSGAA